MGLIDFFGLKANSTDEPGIIDSPWDRIFTAGTPLQQVRKLGYQTLVECCVSSENKSSLSTFIDALEDHDGDPDCYTTLNYFQNFLDQNKIHLIMALDWKAGVEDLEWRVSSSLKQNFNLTLNLPKSQSYPSNASVARRGVFGDYDRVLQENGMQLGFVDTQSDEYVIIVHRKIDREKIKKAVIRVGYDYLDIHDHKGKLAEVL